MALAQLFNKLVKVYSQIVPDVFITLSNTIPQAPNVGVGVAVLVGVGVFVGVSVGV